MFTTADCRGAPCLVALCWGGEDLAEELGALANRDSDGTEAFTFALARSLCQTFAAAAGLSAVDTVYPDFRDTEGLCRRAEQARHIGDRGMLAIHPDQVELINAAFTPTAAEVAAVRTVIDLFSANPGTGAVGYQGAMLDRPYLARAQALVEAGRGKADSDY
ncbi:HpcH/HpaI aldolase/citrate lyase family protein [Nocardia niigatensis]|uniref:HpcH/HpaI aldolase/citrate lyase family protein n=1 Tax=Nocardia niigatensis TaxID=209249 RepID=UPI0002E2F987|nr:aldolase/citrate lyase family protein [Nocardia niigatensis]